MLLSSLINEAVEKVYTTHYRKGGAMATTMPSTPVPLLIPETTLSYGVSSAIDLQGLNKVSGENGLGETDVGKQRAHM